VSGPAHRPAAGFVALELALGIGLLVLPLTMLVLTFPTWSEYQATATTAAAEAAREAVLAPDLQEGRMLGEAVAREVFANHGLARTAVEVRWRGAGSLERGATVIATVTIRMPAAEIPGIGRVGSWHWTATHAEQVDRYRSR